MISLAQHGAAAAAGTGEGITLDWTGAAMVCSFHELVVPAAGNCINIGSNVAFVAGEADPTAIAAASNGDNVVGWYNQVTEGVLGDRMWSAGSTVDLYKEDGTVPVVSFNAE